MIPHSLIQQTGVSVCAISPFDLRLTFNLVFASGTLYHLASSLISSNKEPGPALTAITAALVQTFFAWRVKALTSNMWAVSAIMFFCLVGLCEELKQFLIHLFHSNHPFNSLRVRYSSGRGIRTSLYRSLEDQSGGHPMACCQCYWRRPHHFHFGVASSQ